jgi:hypothetical protein
MVPEQMHDHGPGHRGEDGPGVVADQAGPRLLGNQGQALAGLHGQSSQGEDDTREDVDDDLLVHRRDLAAAPRATAEDEIATYQAGDEGVVFA